MANAPFVVQPQLTAITLAYKNAKMIADVVLPRVPVARQEFKYTTFTKDDTFTIPDTLVGRTSKPNQVDWSATEAASQTRDYALDIPIPNADVENAATINGVTPIDPQARAAEVASDLVILGREKRVADLVFNAASYATANKATLSSTGQWSDYTNSNPADACLKAMDTMIVRPNIMVLGRAVWTILRQHPKLVQAIYGTNQTAGIITAQQLANLLEIDEVIVGEGWYNTAKKGQTLSVDRLWGKYAALLYRNPLTATTQDMTFGVTAQWGSRIGGTINDPDMGARGGVRVRVAESLKELMLATDLGYLFSAAVA